VGFVLEVGFVFVFEAGALVAALAALAAAALAAGFLASAFLLETFFGLVATELILAVVLLEETFGVAVFLTAGFGAVFTLGFLDVAVFLGLSAVSLEVVFLVFSVAVFFTALVAVVFLGFSPEDDGFFVVATLLLVGAAGFSFAVVGGPLYNLTFPDLPFGSVNNSPSPLAMARLKCAMFAALGSRP